MESLRPMDRVPEMELGETRSLLDIVSPYFEEVGLNKRYLWYLGRMAGISVSHGISERTLSYRLIPGISSEDILTALEEIGGEILTSDTMNYGLEEDLQVRWRIKDYFLQDGDDESTGVSLFSMYGVDLFNRGVVRRNPKWGDVSTKLTVLGMVTSGALGINTNRLLNRLEEGQSTCLEAVTLTTAIVTLFPFYRENISDMRIIGLGEDNFFLGSAEDAQHFGLVIKAHNGEYGVMSGGGRVMSEEEIREVAKEARITKRTGDASTFYERNRRDYLAAQMMIRKGKELMR